MAHQGLGDPSRARPGRTRCSMANQLQAVGRAQGGPAAWGRVMGLCGPPRATTGPSSPLCPQNPDQNPAPADAAQSQMCSEPSTRSEPRYPGTQPGSFPGLEPLVLRKCSGKKSHYSQTSHPLSSVSFTQQPGSRASIAALVPVLTACCHPCLHAGPQHLPAIKCSTNAIY